MGQLTGVSYIPVMPLEPWVSRIAVREGSVCVFMCVCVYIYIEREREKDFFAERVNLT